MTASQAFTWLTYVQPSNNTCLKSAEELPKFPPDILDTNNTSAKTNLFRVGKTTL